MGVSYPRVFAKHVDRRFEPVIVVTANVYGKEVVEVCYPYGQERFRTLRRRFQRLVSACGIRETTIILSYSYFCLRKIRKEFTFQERIIEFIGGDTEDRKTVPFYNEAKLTMKIVGGVVVPPCFTLSPVP